MTSSRLCAALAAILAISDGAAAAQSYGLDQPGDPAGYGPAAPPPNDRSGEGGYAEQGKAVGDHLSNYADQRDDHIVRVASYRAQRQLYLHRPRVYERARRDHDMQFGPGAYEHDYAATPLPPGDYDAPR